MTITLESMDEATFENYYAQSLKDYAQEHVKAGSLRKDEALSHAKEQFDRLLPDGLATKEQFLFNVMHDNVAIGILWLRIKSADQGKQAFIFDIELDESQRGKGYGKETMKAIDKFAKSKGITEIRLHVFAHNKRAIALYEQMGYEMTNHHMLKRLS